MGTSDYWIYQLLPEEKCPYRVDASAQEEHIYTEHFQRYFSVTVQVIYQIIQNTIMDHFATEF